MRTYSLALLTDDCILLVKIVISFSNTALQAAALSADTLPLSAMCNLICSSKSDVDCRSSFADTVRVSAVVLCTYIKIMGEHSGVSRISK